MNVEGLLQRVHGGIRLPFHNRNLSFHSRQVINLEAKRRIGQSVAALLPYGTTILLGIGTKPQQDSAALIHLTGLQVITTNLNAAIVLCQNPNITALLTGGRIPHMMCNVHGWS